MSAKVGLLLVVSGKSAKGHSRIGAHGKEWEITKLVPNVAFDTRHGEWLFLKSVKTGYQRWMLLNRDADFSIVSAV